MSYKVKDTSGNTYLVNQGNTTVTRSFNVKYSTAGSYSWTAPTGVTNVTSVQVAGGGGGYGWDCQCNCDCCGDSCIISGKVYTDQGLVDIHDLKIGMLVIDDAGNKCTLRGIVVGKLQNRKSIKIGNCVFTDDHSYIDANGCVCSFDTKGYFASLAKIPTDGSIQGKYINKSPVYPLDDTSITFELGSMPASTSTYTLIVEGADFVKMDGVTASCARFLE